MPIKDPYQIGKGKRVMRERKNLLGRINSLVFLFWLLYSFLPTQESIPNLIFANKGGKI